MPQGSLEIEAPRPRPHPCQWSSALYNTKHYTSKAKVEDVAIKLFSNHLNDKDTYLRTPSVGIALELSFVGKELSRMEFKMFVPWQMK